MLPQDWVMVQVPDGPQVSEALWSGAHPMSPGVHSCVTQAPLKQASPIPAGHDLHGAVLTTESHVGAIDAGWGGKAGHGLGDGDAVGLAVAKTGRKQQQSGAGGECAHGTSVTRQGIEPANAPTAHSTTPPARPRPTKTIPAVSSEATPAIHPRQRRILT
jgi:hypothetical protein